MQAAEQWMESGLLMFGLSIFVLNLEILSCSCEEAAFLWWSIEDSDIGNQEDMLTVI